jgi:hypothetical protein
MVFEFWCLLFTVTTLTNEAKWVPMREQNHEVSISKWGQKCPSLYRKLPADEKIKELMKQ